MPKTNDYEFNPLETVPHYYEMDDHHRLQMEAEMRKLNNMSPEQILWNAKQFFCSYYCLVQLACPPEPYEPFLPLDS